MSRRRVILHRSAPVGAWVLSSLLTASCSGPASRAEGKVHLARGTPAGSLTHVEKPPAPPDVAPLRLEEASCSGETHALLRSSIERRRDLRLCDGTLSSCFLEVDDAQPSAMRLSIGVGTAPRGFVEVRFRGVRLWGFVAGESIQLSPRIPTRLEGFFHATRVHVVEGQPGSLRVKADPGPKVRSAAPLETTLPCEQIAFGDERYVGIEELAPLLGASGTQRHARLAPGSIPLSTAPRLPPVATLEPGVDEEVSVFQSREGFRFVLMGTDSGQVFGWVPQRSVRSSSWVAFGGSSGGGRSFVPIATEWPGRRCPHEVPILARVGGELFGVGAVPSGVVFSVDEGVSGAFQELVLRHQRYTDRGDPPEYRVAEDVRVETGASLLVPVRSIALCEHVLDGEPTPR